ncbi:hypothetical protein BU16DRAFT_581450 [Lophium mytilinum]|uniref:F-box domain-containing protein n=1 Tax=Lophium mytilinum TaxID=390894 RepID=A0A6A6QUZ8_9PEZI|nr:hypothetical protein BU16DRAFT_581450 [Lophium mytilinum]
MSTPPTPSSPPLEAAPPSPNQQTPFLKLPRELRDRIYSYALVWPNIHIRTQLCPAPSSTRVNPVQFAHVRFRATFPIECAPEPTNNEDALGLLDPWCEINTCSRATYSPDPSGSTDSRMNESCDDEVDIGLLSVSRQFRVEAAEVFYRRNTFYFHDYYTGWPASACLAFLRDRPGWMGHIRALSLSAGRLDCGCHEPTHGDWAELWAKVRDEMQLDYLELDVRGLFGDAWDEGWVLGRLGIAVDGTRWRPPPKWIETVLDSGVQVKRLKLTFKVGRSISGVSFDDRIKGRHCVPSAMEKLLIALRKRLLRNGERLVGNRGLRRKSHVAGQRWCHKFWSFDDEKGLRTWESARRSQIKTTVIEVAVIEERTWMCRSREGHEVEASADTVIHLHFTLGFRWIRPSNNTTTPTRTVIPLWSSLDPACFMLRSLQDKMSSLPNSAFIFRCEAPSKKEASPPMAALSSDQPFRFLDLPRELRDRIYGYALIYDQIHIVARLCHVSTVPMSKHQKMWRLLCAEVRSRNTFGVQISAKEATKRQERIEKGKPPVPARPCCRMGVHQLATYGQDALMMPCEKKCDSKVDIEEFEGQHSIWSEFEHSIWDVHEPPEPDCCEKCDQCRDKSFDGPCQECKPGVQLSLLSVSKQVYREAAEVFYKYNTFCFYDHLTGWPASVCLAFLHDRPTGALESIRKIGLFVELSPCSCHVPVDEDWARLLGMISTLQLSDLELGAVAYCAELDDIEEAITSPWILETPMPWYWSSEDGVWIPSPHWISEVLRSGIKVERLALHMEVRRPGWMKYHEEDQGMPIDRLQQHLKLQTMEMRKTLLKKGELLGQRGLRVIDVLPHKEIGWIVAYDCHNDEHGNSLRTPDYLSDYPMRWSGPVSAEEGLEDVSLSPTGGWDGSEGYGPYSDELEEDTLDAVLLTTSLEFDMLWAEHEAANENTSNAYWPGWNTGVGRWVGMNGGLDDWN